ncbi:MAG: type II toxin-antitoxin system VapC family toxin [Tildeniella torsiva UHER 1998/13D]|jgi:PIN domain nuclease of toxin-antitoxin system|nr:type II toxin-antitoxin system VapC family toxin [Tildeniella torsiva UHER 1998/13D]
MKLLLDTHTFIWWDREPNLIPPATLQLMRQPQLLLSLVSLWEIQIKTQLGKLNLNMSLPDLVEHHQENGMALLAISLPHILALEQLPQYHRDPFDRLLIAQGRVESTTIVSRDDIFKSYDCQLIW